MRQRMIGNTRKKILSILLNQTGTDDPTYKIYENPENLQFEITRYAQGSYSILFETLNTPSLYSRGIYFTASTTVVSSSFFTSIGIDNEGADTITIYTRTPANTTVDSVLVNVLLEVWVEH